MNCPVTVPENKDTVGYETKFEIHVKVLQQYREDGPSAAPATPLLIRRASTRASDQEPESAAPNVRSA